MKTKLLFLALACLVILTGGLGAIIYNFSKTSDENRIVEFPRFGNQEPPPRFVERLQQVERAIADVNNLHENWQRHYFWVGRYEFSHDHGFAELSLSPRSYALREYSRHWEIDYRHGGVWWNRDRNTITLDGTSHYPLEYVPVRWGKRLYLIPIPRIKEFCDSVNRGTEPRNDRGWGVFLLRQGDWEKEVTGKPEVPEEFKKYLLDEPVDAMVLSADVRTDTSRRLATITLNKGSNDGLLPGMTLYVVEPDNIHASVNLSIVEETQSKGETHYAHLHQTDIPSPTTGWIFSTRPRQYRNR